MSTYAHMIQGFSKVQSGAVGTGHNDTRLKDFLKDVAEFGRDSALGKDSLPKLAMRVVEAANDGIITSGYDPADPKGKKTNKDVDDTPRVYGAYLEAESKKAVHEHDAASVKAQVSKLRQLVRLGEYPNCEPMEVVEKTVAERKLAKAAGFKVKAVYPALVDVARRQLNSPQQLDDAEIREMVLKRETVKDTNLDKVLRRILGELEVIVSGEGKGKLAGLKDTNPHTIDAFESLRERLRPEQPGNEPSDEGEPEGIDEEDDERLYESSVMTPFVEEDEAA